jgi:hypothetical protein
MKSSKCNWKSSGLWKLYRLSLFEVWKIAKNTFGIYAYCGLENSFQIYLLTSKRPFAGWLPFIGLGTWNGWTASEVGVQAVGRLCLSSLFMPAFLSLWKIQYASLLMLSLYSLIPVLKKAGRPYANPVQNKQPTVQNQPTFVAYKMWNATKVSYDNYTKIQTRRGWVTGRGTCKICCVVNLVLHQDRVLATWQHCTYRTFPASSLEYLDIL